MDTNFNYDKNTLRELVMTYMMAKAYYETIHEKEIECDKRVLESHIFYKDEKWMEMIANHTKKRILDPEDSYLMNEQDSQEYYTLIYEEYKKEGIDHPNGRTWIPSSIAKDLLRKSENALMDYAIDIAPEELRETLETAKHHWKYRDTLLNIILRLDCGQIEKEDFKKEGWL